MRLAALLTFIIILVIMAGCPVKHQEECEVPVVNYDSLFSLGDSAMKQHYIQQAMHQLVQDSLNRAMVTYKDQLINRVKVESEIRKRIIFKDTTIIRRHIVRQVDTIRMVIRDTVYIPFEVVVDTKKKRKRKR